MEHNKNLKRTLREEKPLPNSLGWEQVQEGIFERMKQPERKPRGFFFLHWRRILGVTLLVLNFSVMAYLVYLVQQKEQLGAFPIPMESASHSSDLPKKQAENSSWVEASVNEILKEEKSTIISAKNRPSEKENITYPDASIVNQYEQSSERITAIELPPEPIEKLELQTGYLQEKIGVKEQMSSVAEVKYLKSFTHPLEVPTPETNMGDFKIKYAAFVPYHTLEFSGGVNNWQSNYNEAITEQNTRAASETELWGFQLAAHVKYHFKPNVYVSSGLTFQQLNHRFNYEKTNKEQVEARDALVEIAINSISGDSTFVRKDVLVEVEEKRTVQHHNRHQILTLPVRVGYEWKYNRIALSGSLGSVFSIQSFSKGKTLVGSEVKTYDRDDSIYKKRFGLGLSANIQLNYALTPNLYVGGNVGYNNWLGNWSTESAVTLRPNISQFSVLVGKKF
ncbi:MAG: hypothetical protein AAF806_06100 [Bacteroidota bacterium]